MSDKEIGIRRRKYEKELLVELDFIISSYKKWLDSYYKEEISSKISDADLMKSLDFVSKNMQANHNKEIMDIKKSYLAMVDCLKSIGDTIMEIENEHP